MESTLNQKRGFNYRKFTLANDKIKVETKTSSKIEKFEIKVEKLGLDILYQADNTSAGKAFFFICIVAPITITIYHFTYRPVDLAGQVLMYGLFWFFALLNVLKQHQDDILIVGGERSLSFCRNIPSEGEVLAFIGSVNQATKKSIAAKYLVFDSLTTPRRVCVSIESSEKP